jgi:hypothetical protein
LLQFRAEVWRRRRRGVEWRECEQRRYEGDEYVYRLP